MTKLVLTILHTESSLGWGGQEHRTFKEMVGLRRLGHRMILLCQPKAKFGARAREAGFDVFEVRMRNGIDLPAVWRMQAIIRREKVDVVNTHSGRDSILGGLAGLLAGRLVVRTRHLALPITSRFTYTTLPHHVVSVSEHVRRYLISEGVPENRVTTVYTGVDPEQLRAPSTSTLCSELGLSASTLLIGTVAILRGKKGHRYILDAAPAILKACPDAHFVFAGDGPQYENIQSRISEQGLQDRVHLLGLRRDIANVLSGLDLFVLPTQQEALGTAYIEAMTHGLAIVGSNVDGVPEVVSDGVNGFLIDPFDAGALAEKVIQLLQDETLRKKMGQVSLQQVESRFHVDSMNRQMQDLYHKLLANREKV